MFHIRPFERTEMDYRAAADIQSATWSDCLNSLSMWKRADDLVDSRSLVQRLVAVEQGDIVGLAVLVEPEQQTEPGKYDLSIIVRPEHQRQGIGSAFYRHMLHNLNGRPLVKITSGTREDKQQGIRFLNRFGFNQVMRAPLCSLNVTKFNAARFAGIWERMARQGIQVLPLTRAALAYPDWQRRIWDLDWGLKQELPSPLPLVRLPFEKFQRSVLGQADFKPAAWFVALDNNRWVGISRLMELAGEPGKLYHGLTGVVPSHRRRGIATALKISAIEYARQAGAEWIETENEENNPMYALNMKLGFQPLPAWLHFEKEAPLAS
jgi:GNAT superfamily N-acetyltransferase